MKIKKLHVINFKNIEDMTYTPANITAALIGHNGKGKTAFREAFYAGLTGDFPDNCITEGKNQCSVEIELEDGTVFQRIQDRIKPNKVVVNGKTSNLKTLNEIITVKTGLTKDALRIVGSTDVLESLKPSEFGTFIMDYVPEKLDYATVLSYIPGIKRKAQEVLEKVLPPMPDTFGMAELTSAYNHFVEQRKLAKKELSTRTAKVDSFKLSEPKRSLTVIEADLADTLRKDGAQKSERTAAKLYESAVENKAKAEKALADLKTRIDANTSTRPNPAILASIDSQKKEANRNIVNAKTMINTINENIATFNNTLINLDKPVCPISEKLICTTDKTKVKDELTELINSNKEGLDIQKEIVDENTAKLTDLDAQEKEYRANESFYKEKTLLINRYEEQKKAIPTLPPKPAATTIVDYSWDIKELQAERNNALAWEEHKKNLEEQEAFQVEVDTYEFLCAALNPKGSVVCRIIEYYLGVFQSIANTTAFELRPGFEIKFVADAGVTYLVRTDTGREWQTFETLSSGEQLLTLFIIIDMLNQLTDAKLMFLDDLDKLDKDAFKELLTLINKPSVQSRYDHIVISAVNHDGIINELKKYSVDWIYPV